MDPVIEVAAHWSRPARALSRRGLLASALVVGAAGCIGFVLTRSPLAALLLVACVAIAGLAVSLESLALAELALATLPWFVVLADLAPPLVKTFTSAGAVLAVLIAVSPVELTSSSVKAGVFCWLSALLVAVVSASAGDQFTEAAKYLIFPAIAIGVTSKRASVTLSGSRGVLLKSGTLAVATHVVVILLGAGAVGAKYGVGERLGYASASAHDLTLLSMIVATAGLAGATRSSARLAYLCLGTIPAIASGVRSALIAVVLVLLLFLIKSRLNLRAIAIVAVAALVVLASGMFSVVENRYRQDRSRGEFATINAIGSGRGGIWDRSLHRWEHAGPTGWAWGTGLRSIARQELSGNEGHSDVVQAGVELGLVGLVGWLLIWIGLLRARLSGLVLVPIGVYAILNGTLEYVDSLVFGLALAAACAGEQSAIGDGLGAIRRVRGLQLKQG
jgi:hypothetical protein